MRTFDELERSLPNGFHDATILDISFDCVRSRAHIWISVHASKEGDANREEYRVGLLDVRSIHLFFFDRPGNSHNIGTITGGIKVSGDDVTIGQDIEVDDLLKKLPSGANAYRFFMEDWNSFFYIAASEAAFSWE